MTVWKRQKYGDNRRLCWGEGCGKGWAGRAQRTFRAVKRPCVWPRGGYVSSCVCLNPQNVAKGEPQRQRVFRGWWCVSVSSSAVTSVPLGRGIYVHRDSMGPGAMCKISAPSSHFCCELNVAKKKKKKIKSKREKKKWTARLGVGGEKVRKRWMWN